MIKLSTKQYLAIGGVLLTLVTSLAESGLVPPQYLSALSFVGTLLGLLLGRKPGDPAPSAPGIVESVSELDVLNDDGPGDGAVP